MKRDYKNEIDMNHRYMKNRCRMIHVHVDLQIDLLLYIGHILKFVLYLDRTNFKQFVDKQQEIKRSNKYGWGYLCTGQRAKGIMGRNMAGHSGKRMAIPPR